VDKFSARSTGTTIARRGALALVAVALLGALSGCALLDLLQPTPTTPPAHPPTEVTASQGEYATAVRIQWEAVEGAEFYRVFRADSAEGPFEELGTTTNTYVYDQATEGHAVEPGRLYWYRVQACNGAGCSGPSEAASGYAGFPPPPANVQASDGTYTDRIVVTWDPVPGATRYEVFRDTAEGGTYPFLGESTTNTYVDQDVLAGQQYWYKVRACNTLGCSLPSAPDSGCVEPCLGP
jgi:fibronectin type 3 domain-containing protein